MTTLRRDTAATSGADDIMNRIAPSLALSLALALAAAPSCGKSEPTPTPAADTTPAAAADTAPAPPSPVEEGAKLLEKPSLAEGDVAAVLAAADAAEKHAAAHADEAPKALALAARLRLVGALLGPDPDRARQLRQVAELGAKAGAPGADTAAAAKALLWLDPANDDVAQPDIAALLANAGIEADAVRAGWLRALADAFSTSRKAAVGERLTVLSQLAGRTLCAGCAKAGELEPGALERFLLEADNGGAALCAGGDAAKDATTAAARAAALTGCAEATVEGGGEPALGAGDNALFVAALRRALWLDQNAAEAASKAPTPLTGAVTANQKKLEAAMNGIFPLPTPALVESVPAGAQRPEGSALPLAAGGLGTEGGLAVDQAALVVAVVGPEGISVGMRPTVQVADKKVSSVAKGQSVAIEGVPIVKVADLGTLEPAPETGALAPLQDAATKVVGVVDQMRSPADGPRVGELVVDADASSLAVVRTLDSLRAAGVTDVRFTRTATLGKTLPLVTRAAPEKLPEGVTVGFARPVIVHVAGDHVDVWGPESPADPAPKAADPAPALPENADPGYRKKDLARLRVPVPEGDRETGLSADTLKHVAGAIDYWLAATGAGRVVHVVGDGDVRAFDVLRVARAFQEADGTALAAPETVWPESRCAEDPCASGIAVAFSGIEVPSDRGVSGAPSEAKTAPPKPPVEKAPPASPEFCNKADIKAQMARKRGDFRFCYESQLRGNQDLEGRVALKFAIDLAGNVVNPSTAGSTIGDKKVTDCIVKTVSKIHFAKPDGGMCLVSYPFVFTAK